MNMEEEEQLEIIGARVHNLKNIDVVIPRNKLVVITGLSGSGKSSLAFDTIFAEGQRRYIESFSIYARQFLGNLERPDVDRITGLSPVISIEQKTTNKNPRSTVGTITEIYDFLRLLYARSATAYSYVSGKPMVKYTDDQIINIILEKYSDKKISILAPVVKGRKGHYRELFEQIIKQGFIRARIDGEVTELKARMQLDRYKIHNIEIVIDRFTVTEEIKARLVSSLQLGMRMAKGSVAVLDNDSNELSFYSRALMCADSGVSYDDPAPNSFSFNSPFGACTKCNGLGLISQIDQKKLIPNPKMSIKKGGILALGEARNSWIFEQISALGGQHGFNLDTPIEDIPEEVMDIILYGSNELVRVKNAHSGGTHSVQFEGIVNFIARQQEELGSKSIEKWAESFMNKVVCPKCNGARLKQESLYYKIDSKNIFELSSMNLKNLKLWFENLEQRMTEKQNIIAAEVLKEIRPRIQFLLDVGLGYLELNRTSQSLSGGESQRIRLATQIGSQLVGVLYILDEPSIGLHQRDNTRLIKSLISLRDTGNSVIVVEHDKEMIEQADYVLERYNLCCA